MAAPRRRPIWERSESTGRLHSAVGYLTSRARLKGCDQAILDKRDRKLEVARESRKQQRQAARQAALDG